MRQYLFQVFGLNLNVLVSCHSPVPSERIVRDVVGGVNSKVSAANERPIIDALCVALFTIPIFDKNDEGIAGKLNQVCV